MWRVILAAAVLHILTVQSRPAERQVDPPWGRSDEDMMKTLFPLEDLQQVFGQRDFQRPENGADSSDDFDSLVPHVQYDKRALAMMARWSPFSAMGKQRAPIRSASYIDPDATINTQTRSRMVGQPLRWG